MAKKKSLYSAVGRRKQSVAQVRLVPKTGKGEGGIFVNGKPIDDYFRGKVYEKFYLEPFRITNTIGRFRVEVKVEGGGVSGQLGACIHAFSRVLLEVDEKFRPILKKRGLLTRDARAKERRKAGLAGKARKKKQSPKR